MVGTKTVAGEIHELTNLRINRNKKLEIWEHVLRIYRIFFSVISLSNIETFKKTEKM